MEPTNVQATEDGGVKPVAQPGGEQVEETTVPTPETPVEAPAEVAAEPEAAESATPSEPEAAPAEEVPAAPEEPASEE